MHYAGYPGLVVSREQTGAVAYVTVLPRRHLAICQYDAFLACGVINMSDVAPAAHVGTIQRCKSHQQTAGRLRIRAEVT